MDHNLAISDHLPAPHCSAFLHCAKLASRTTGKDIALCATVLSFWEHFILLFWSASYILLTLEHAHCSLALNLALLRLFNCRLHCSCLPAALALVLNCSSSLSIWSGNTLPACPTFTRNVLLPDQLEPAYGWTTDFSCKQLVTFSTILALAAFLNQSTILNARMQSTEKNHNWRNFENFKNIVGKCYWMLSQIHLWNISSLQSKQKYQMEFPPLLFPNIWFSNRHSLSSAAQLN